MLLLAQKQTLLIVAGIAAAYIACMDQCLVLAEMKMDRMNEIFDAVSVEASPISPSLRGRPLFGHSLTPITPESVQREHRELFTLLTDYNLAVAEGANRKRLLAIFDATFECVKKHFRSVEALLEQSSWSSFQRHYRIHRQIIEELAAYRIRLAGNEPLDAVECAHVLDATLIQFIREQPLFKRLYGLLDRSDER